MNFDDYATTWDTYRRILRAKDIAKEIKKMFKLEMNTTKNLTALEFGCGTGLISFNLDEYFKKIYLIDSSKEMINITEEKIRKYHVMNMETFHTDLLDENSFNKKVDVIYSSMVLHHINDIESIVKKLYSLLNNNGMLIIVDLDKEDGSFHKYEENFMGHNGFDQKEFKQLLENIGFTVVNIHTFYHDVKLENNEEIKYSLFIIKGKK